jgi:hypothetical protein
LGRMSYKDGEQPPTRQNLKRLRQIKKYLTGINKKGS